MYDNIYIHEKLMVHANSQLTQQTERARMIKEARVAARQERKIVKPVRSENFLGRLLHRPGF